MSSGSAHCLQSRHPQGSNHSWLKVEINGVGKKPTDMIVDLSPFDPTAKPAAAGRWHQYWYWELQYAVRVDLILKDVIPVRAG